MCGFQADPLGLMVFWPQTNNNLLASVSASHSPALATLLSGLINKPYTYPVLGAWSWSIHLHLEFW